MNTPTTSNPNAVAGTVSGAGGGALIVWVLSLVGLNVDPYIATILAGVTAGVVLFIGRNGIQGALRKIWKGSGQ